MDLRQNGGGDNRTYRPLLESLERLGSEKRLAVLTSRLTFSAAMQLIVELEQDTQAVFVGEPTGGSPNQYGDATKVELPNSGLNAFVATVAWKTAGEFDDRVTRMPDIPVRQNSTAFFAGNDPVLDCGAQIDSCIPPPQLPIIRVPCSRTEGIVGRRHQIFPVQPSAGDAE